MKKTLRGTCLYPAGKGMPAGRTHRNLVRTQARAFPRRDDIINTLDILASAVRAVFYEIYIRQEGAGA